MISVYTVTPHTIFRIITLTSITMLQEKFSSSTMVTLTMSVIFPEPVTGRTGSEYTLPGFVILVPDMATRMPLPALT